MTDTCQQGGVAAIIPYTALPSRVCIVSCCNPEPKSYTQRRGTSVSSMHTNLVKEPSPLTADAPVLGCSDGQGTAEPSVVLKAADGILPSAVICEGVILAWTSHKGTIQHMGID